MSTTSHTEPPTANRARRSRPTVGELRDRPLHLDRLWMIEDVATCLGYSVRLTEQIVKDPRVPQPRLVARGGDRRWSPTHWQRWMDTDDTTYLAEIVDEAEGRLAASDAEMAVI
jgi:hypothetical protein